jgi:hypothetical protein
MKRLKFILAGLVVLSSLSFTTTLALPSPRAAAACTDSVLTFPAWYKGLQSSSCDFQPKLDDSGRTDFQATIIIITLNVVNIIMQLVGYAAAVMLIVGGFFYMVAQGEADKMSGAKKTITNAIIGLVVSILSVAIVNLIAGAF